MNKVTGIVGTVVVGVVILGGSLIYINHKNDTIKIEKNISQQSGSSLSENKSSSTENFSSSANNISSSEVNANQNFSNSIKNRQDITLEEGLNLIKKAGGEVPSSDVKIISSEGKSITIGGGAGAKGYDKITLTPDGNGNVAIHEEFGTLSGGSYSVIDYMPAKDFTILR